MHDSRAVLCQCVRMELICLFCFIPRKYWEIWVKFIISHHVQSRDNCLLLGFCQNNSYCTRLIVIQPDKTQHTITISLQIVIRLENKFDKTSSAREVFMQTSAGHKMWMIATNLIFPLLLRKSQTSFQNSHFFFILWVWYQCL